MDTPGGRIHVQWDHGASAGPNAQLTFFAEFLAATGVYESCVLVAPGKTTLTRMFSAAWAHASERAKPLTQGRQVARTSTKGLTNRIKSNTRCWVR